MRKIVLALAAVAILSSACAGGTPDPGGYATQDGAAFMGYHGPAWRANSPAD